MQFFFVQAIILVAALSLDAFVASFSYGVNKIKIPFASCVVITLIASSFLAAALFIGAAFSSVIPSSVAKGLGAGILIVIGTAKLFDSLIKGYIKKHNGVDKKIAFKLSSLSFILSIYADPAVADADESKCLSVREAAALAIVLSIDGLTAGLGAGLAAENVLSILFIIGVSIIGGVLFILLGALLGRFVAKKSNLSLAWISGLLLIGLGVASLFL